MKVKIRIFIAWVAVSLGLLLMICGCVTKKNYDSTVLLHSAGRDSKIVETAIKNYRVQIDRYESFAERVDPINFYEDVETRMRTQFAIFKGEAGIECTLGLTNQAMTIFKNSEGYPLEAKASAPGRTHDLYQSQLSFSYEVHDGKSDRFLITCIRPGKRITMSDVSKTLDDFILFESINEKTPHYNVCCSCKRDSYTSVSNQFLIKGETANFLMVNSTDSVCKNRLDTKQKNILRPGDLHYKVGEERYYILTKCEETKLDDCESQILDEEKFKSLQKNSGKLTSADKPEEGL